MKVTNTSPLRLEATRLSNLTIEYNEKGLEANALHLGGDAAADYTTDVDFSAYKLASGDERHLVTLTLSMRRSSEVTGARFERISFRVSGIFAPHAGCDEGLFHELIPTNCLAILHGIARGLVASATGLCLGGSFVLPALNYRDLVMRKARTLKRREAELVRLSSVTQDVDAGP